VFISVWDHDLHELMRRGATDEKLAEFIVKVVEKKEERHHIGEPGFVPASRTMVHIGGKSVVGRRSLVAGRREGAHWREAERARDSNTKFNRTRRTW